MEKVKSVQVLALAVCMVILGVSIAALPVWGQEAKLAPQKVDMSKITCKEFMAGNDNDREVNMAFMHGFFAGKKGNPVVDINAVTVQTEKVRDYCLSNPTSTVMDAFAKIAK